MLTEIWVEINVPRAVNVALVLDASESAQMHWREILSFANDLTARLGRSSQCRIYFLGDTAAYTIDDLESQHSRLFSRHRLRASVVGPLLELLACEETLCIVLGAGPIFDLEDWIGTSIAERLLVVNFGEQSVSAGFLPECHASLEQVMAARPVAGLLGTPLRLEVSGNAVMPFFWDNHSYKWRELTLAAESAENWQVHVGVLCLNPTDIKAITTTSGGITLPATQVLSLPRPWSPNWTLLSADDVTIFRDSLQTDRYLCPICGKQHRTDVLRCPDDPESMLGRYAYSFLQARHGATFVLLKDSDEDPRFAFYPCEALRVGRSCVAIRSGNRADVYEFDFSNAGWRKTNRVKQYMRIEDGVYVLAVR